MTRSLAVGTALLALVLSACSDDGGGDDAAPSPAPSSSAASTPSETPSEAPVEPPLPAVATKPTKAGAKAFITYYWDLVNYAQATGDVSELRTVSTGSCRTCQGLVRDIQNQYVSGGEILGGANEVDILSTQRLTVQGRDVIGFKADLMVSHGPQTIVDPQGGRDERSSGRNEFTAYVRWSNEQSGWRTDVLDLV